MYEELLAKFDSGDESNGIIETTIVDGVAIVALCNERARNALSLAMWQQLEETFNKLAEEPDLRAIVVRGTGTTAFAAGANIAEFPDNRLTASSASRYNEYLAGALRAIATVPIPTIAMIRGYAVGGGCELSAACDLRIGSDTARIGIPIGRLGVILGVTETQMLTRHIGVNGLKRLLFSGELFDAPAALQLGLLDEVVTDDELVGRVSDLLRAITTSSATTMRASKVITDLSGDPDAAAAERVHQLMVETYDGEDLKEGVTAFLEKRQPVFSGKAKV